MNFIRVIITKIGSPYFFYTNILLFKYEYFLSTAPNSQRISIELSNNRTETFIAEKNRIVPNANGACHIPLTNARTIRVTHSTRQCGRARTVWEPLGLMAASKFKVLASFVTWAIFLWRKRRMFVTWAWTKPRRAGLAVENCFFFFWGFIRCWNVA